MNKSEALALLGGTTTSAAGECGLTVSAVSQWPDPLTPRHVDIVQAALYRKRHGLKRGHDPAHAEDGADGAPPVPTAEPAAEQGA